MTFTQWVWRVASNIGLIIRQGHSHGRGRIFSAYLKIELKRFFLAGLLKRRITSEKVFGYDVQFFEYETFAILFEEVYLSDVYFFRPANMEPLIIDCGSNIGLATLYFKKLFPNCTIIAFEADTRTFKMLERNVEANNLKNVSLINRALYDSKGTVPFYIAAGEPNLVQSIRQESLAHSKPTVMETALLSEHIEAEVDMLKMDIEGAEEMVLRDLEQAGKLPLVKEMVLEYHHHISPSEDRLGKFLSILEGSNFGYQVRAPFPLPFYGREFQGFLIYAYRH